MEIASLLISTITLLGGVFMFWRYDRRIKSQEERLNEYQIRKNKQEEEDNKKAKIAANVVKGDKGKRIIKVYNCGIADAYNINFEFEFDDDSDETKIFVTNMEVFPYKKLTPSSGTEFYIHMTNSTPNVIDVKLTWKDEYSDYNEYTQTLTL